MRDSGHLYGGVLLGLEPLVAAEGVELAGLAALDEQQPGDELVTILWCRADCTAHYKCLVQRDCQDTC